MQAQLQVEGNALSSHGGDVRQVVEKFYSGRSAEGCFVLYYGRFEFYRQDQTRP